jgi:hypothetical protein
LDICDKEVSYPLMRSSTVRSIPSKLLFEVGAVLLCLCAVVYLHSLAINRYSLGWDEWADVETARCLYSRWSFTQCSIDGTQFRLPHIVDALVMGTILGLAGKSDFFSPFALAGHQYLSLLFVLLTIGGTWYLARSLYGRATALVTILMMTVSCPLLASAIMIGTHSNSLPIFIFFAASVTAALVMQRASIVRCAAFVLCELFLMWSSVLCVPLALLLLMTVVCHLAWDSKWFTLGSVCTAIVLLVSGVFVFHYVSPIPGLSRLIGSMPLKGKFQPWWNPMQLGLSTAPWYFSIVICVVKFSPWWSYFLPFATVGYLRRRDLHSFEQIVLLNNIALFLFLFLKSSIFKYDAPHHQVFLYPLAYLSVAAFMVRAFSKEGHLFGRAMYGIAMVGGLALEVCNVAAVAPAYWFSGAQYSRRLITEFSGPAIMDPYRQDFHSTTWREANKLRKRGMLVQGMSREVVPVKGDNYVEVKRGLSRYYYAPKANYFEEVLQRRCKIIASDEIAYGIEQSVLFDCRGQRDLFVYEEFSAWLREYPAKIRW